MNFVAIGLPRHCTFSDVDLARSINSLKGILSSSHRPAEYRKLSRSAWDKERAQMRFLLGTYTELLRLRIAAPVPEAPLPEVEWGFDSDLLTEAEIEALRAASLNVVAVKVLSEIGFDVSSSPFVRDLLNEQRSRARTDLVDALTAVCNLRRQNRAQLGVRKAEAA